MIRRIALAAAAGALALGGLAVAGNGVANAAPPSISVATSANIKCNITATATLSPALKNNWVQAQHQPSSTPPESNANVNAIPDTTFAVSGPTTTSAKAKSISCDPSSTATDGTNTAQIVSLKITLGQSTPAVDNPPLQPDGTCTGLTAGTAPEDTAATYGSHVTFKTTGAKLAPTDVAGSSIAPSGFGFAITGGTITGSMAGGNSKSQAYIDGATIAAVGAAPANSTQPTPSSTTCQASLKIKPTSATLKAPKGLKKIIITNDFVTNNPSYICIRKGSTCP
jgi:hypothetical protein